MAGKTSILQRELRQTKPFRSSRQELVIALIKTADVLHRFMSQVIEPYGVTPQQYNVLRILRGAGEEGIATLAIAERMIEEAPGMTRMIDRLEAKELVIRQRSESDRRQVRCYLTANGARLLRRLDGPVDAAEEAAVSSLGKQDVAALVALLERILVQHIESKSS